MSSWLIVLVGIIYACVAYEQLNCGNIELAAVFGGYTLSNVGLYYLTS